MLPSSNQPAQLYGTAKTHKFDDVNEITVDLLMFRPMIAQTGTSMYKTAHVISEYLRPLYENNDFIIKNTQDFAQLIHEHPPLEENEEYVSFVELLFRNILICDTVKYILQEIYTHNKLPHICIYMYICFLNWDSLHVRLNSHCEAWSYKKRSTIKITGYRKSV